MRGYPGALSSMGIEALVGSQGWFSQALCPSNFQVAALGQAGLDGKGARLNWLLTVTAGGPNPLPELLDHIAMEAGLREARFLIAGSRLDDCLFEILRRAGFCTFGWQVHWEVKKISASAQSISRLRWRRADLSETHAIETFQRRLLAPAVQSVTEFASSKLPDFICFDDDRIYGIAFLECFNNKALIKPLLERNLDRSQELLLSLITEYFFLAQIVYIQQTSDQAWLTAILESFAHQVQPREELLVKHFAAVEKVPVTKLNHANNRRQSDTVTPMMPSTKHGDNL